MEFQMIHFKECLLLCKQCNFDKIYQIELPNLISNKSDNDWIIYDEVNVNIGVSSIIQRKFSK